jgi:hypothetical protein
VAGDDPLGRLRLFERLGARVLGVPFVQPALGAGGERVGGFLLLAFHVDPSVEIEFDGQPGVPTDLLAGFVRRYYETSEGIRPPYDAQLARLLGRIDEQPMIPLLPVGQYHRVPPLASV